MVIYFTKYESVEDPFHTFQILEIRYREEIMDNKKGRRNR